MNIQTSYFASRAPLERRVSIAKWPPRNYRGVRAKELAPRDPKDPESNLRYREYLEKTFPGPVHLEAYLGRLCEKVPDPILLCFEHDPAGCHRRVFAQFAEEMLGILVPEWKDDTGLLRFV